MRLICYNDMVLRALLPEEDLEEALSQEVAAIATRHRDAGRLYPLVGATLEEYVRSILHVVTARVGPPPSPVGA